MEALELLAGFGIRPRGIIHVGANRGQEFPAYQACAAKTVLYIEPVSAVFETLKRTVELEPGHHAICALCSDRSGAVVTFNIASNAGQSSSMLELGNHAKLFPRIVYEGKEELQTQTLDDIVAKRWASEDFNLLVIDVQGAELLVLKGATRLLRQVEAVYIEVAELPLYEGGCTWREIDGFLSAYGFFLKHMSLNIKHLGNALFVKQDAVFSLLFPKSVQVPGRNVALGKPAQQSSQYGSTKRHAAGKAVNGIKTGLCAFHTALEDSPWWQVDLEVCHALTAVLVYNRLDTGSKRAYWFVVKVSTDGENWELVHRQAGEPFGGVDGNPARVPLYRIPARYVRIELEGRDYLHLDQVEVYGDPLPDPE